MRRLPNFILAEAIYERGQTALYRGTRESDGAPVVVKLLAGHDISGQEEARLRHEYRILKAIDAPSVVRALALVRGEGTLGLVLEHVPGRPLDAVLRERRLPIEDALAIGAGVSRALVAVHRAGVVHRDIKPANLIVDLEAGAIKLVDFGIAARRGEPARRNAIEGSLSYLAPEQTGRMERGFDARSDLYALGVTLYEMLTGRLPFVETDPLMLVHAHLARAPAPPREVDPAIPEIVSEIVARQLRKAPEDRYQSAAGLLFDLEACLSDLRDTGMIQPFVPGCRDVPVDLASPGDLFGRDAERAALLDAYERAALGGVELVVLEGPPGIGKSALVRDLAATVASRGGLLGAGKCEQTGRAAPFAAVAQALGDLSRDVDGQAASELFEALGPNGGVLADLVPEVLPLLHPPDRPPALGPEEAKNRLVIVVERTLAVLARRRPIVLFLDDVQWIDSATLDLLQGVMAGGRALRLLVVLAMREGEVTRVVDTLAVPGHAAMPFCTLRIGPLNRDGTRSLVADVLRLPPSRVGAAADGVFARTGGNPLFVVTLLGALHAAGALAVDTLRGEIEADFRAVAVAGDGTDVVALLGRKLGQLSSRARRAIILAAILGSAFDMSMLAAAADLPEDDLATALDEAAGEGFLVPAGGGFQFAHDRVQLAALALVDEAERRAIELSAGRRLWARVACSPRDEDLFAAVLLLNAAATLIDDPKERAALARDDLRAGQKARARAAFDAGKRYFEAGVRLLDEESWERDHALAFALVAETCECEASIGDVVAARARIEELSRRARGPLERVRVAAVRVDLYLREGKNAEAAAAGCEALRAAGVDLPATEEGRRVALDRAERATSPMESRLDAPEMTDPSALAIERLLMAVAIPAYFTSPSLYGLVTSAWLSLLAEHGHSNISAMSYALHGAFLMTVEGRGSDAYAFGRLAVDLLERRRNLAIVCRVIETVSGNIAFLHEPLRDVLSRLPGALRAGIDAGDMRHASYICGHIAYMRIALGDDLAEVEAQMEELIAIAARTADVYVMAVLRVVRRILWDLIGRMGEPPPPSDARWGEAAIVELAEREDFAMFAGFRHTQRLLVSIIRGAWKEALAEARAAEAKGPHPPDQLFTTELAFLAALVRLRAAPLATSAEHRLAPDGSEEALAAYRDSLRSWAAQCPSTYRSKHLLVEAEAARTKGEELSAMRLYDKAIGAARENELVRDEAIASELCAEFHAEHGRTSVARVYWADARAAYRRWGALGKVAALDARLSGQPHARALREAPEGMLLGDVSAMSSSGLSTLLDATAVVQAAQAIATELVLARVIEQLLRLVAGVSGAERAIMLVERDSGWLVVGRLGPEGIEAGLEEPLDGAVDLAASVVRHVAQTGESIVLSDAVRADGFGLDPYIAQQRTRSVLCMEVAHAGRRAGILYLENNAARGAFAKDRLRPIGVLAAQAAIAIENAQLYERLRAATEELRSMNESLENEVARQTKALRQELRARQESEQAYTVLAEEIIRVQKERLAELSVPLLPIAEGVVLVPLVGTMDAVRAADVLETTLRGASAWSARVVLLDVTAMKGAGEGVSEMLLRTARALGLLGAEAVITGIRPEVAHALVGVGADLSALTTRGTLKSGITYALRRAGRSAR